MKNVNLLKKLKKYCKLLCENFYFKKKNFMTNFCRKQIFNIILFKKKIFVLIIADNIK